MCWETKGFDGFSRGEMGNGGQNIYVSRQGVLQRIFQYDVNGDGYPDLLFANSQSMYERPPVYVFDAPLQHAKYRELPTQGAFEGTMCDLDGDGYDDLILACQNNGTLSDITAIIYYGSKEGLSERYRIELPAPDAIGVAAGDFDGDGKKDLVFVSGDRLRVFYQQERGFSSAEFTEILVEAVSVCATDIDGDGYDDLYVKYADGRAKILWGSVDGLCADRGTWVCETVKTQKNSETASTTALRLHAYLRWKACVVRISDKPYLFCPTEEQAEFFTCETDRKIKWAFSLPVSHTIAAATGDLDGDGVEDIAITVCKDKDAVEESLVFWGAENGFDSERHCEIPTTCAQSVLIADLEQNGKAQLVISQAGTSKMYTTETLVCSFAADRIAASPVKLPCGDCMRALVGRTSEAKTMQLFLINHEMNRAQGDEDVVVYLGGEDGYCEDRCYKMRGRSCVEGVLCDFDDNGLVDALIVNCAEDAPHLDDGSYIYFNDGGGFDEDRKVKVPTIRAHGAAIGDFRRSGYLDIATGGFNNREFCIYHGGPEGYTRKNVTKIVLGPDDDCYTPPIYESVAAYNQPNTTVEGDLIKEFGQVRWVLSADFNGDGWLDIFISEISGSRSFILWGGPDGFSKRNMSELLTDGVASANAVDLDGDGYLDLILAAHQSVKKQSKYESYVTIYWGGADGYTENRKTQLPVTCANSVTVGDYNGNGCFDIYATAYNNGRVRDLLSQLYIGAPDGSYSVNRVEYLFNHSGSGCVSGDFNRDGYTDLVVANHKEYGNHMSHSVIYWGGPDGLSEERKTVLPTVGPHGMSTVDPGNLMDRGPKEYYTSKIREVPIDKKVKSIQWEGVCTSTSWVEVELRCANLVGEVEDQAWVPVKPGEELSIKNMRGYLQYRLALCANCACGTPRITGVSVDFE